MVKMKKYTEVLIFRITKQQKEDLVVYCEEQKIEISAYCRHMIFGSEV